MELLTAQEEQDFLNAMAERYEIFKKNVDWGVKQPLPRLYM